MQRSVLPFLFIGGFDSSALCRSRRELSNEYLLAKFGFDTAENKPYHFVSSSSREFEFKLWNFEPLICSPEPPSLPTSATQTFASLAAPPPPRARRAPAPAPPSLPRIWRYCCRWSTWPSISDLELCPYPFPGIRFRLPVCPFSFFRAICPFSREKTLFPIIFRKMLHFGKIPKTFG